MKIRTNYVSNSSSSSFIIDFDSTDKGISCIKLSDEIIKCLCENAKYIGDKLMDLSQNKSWYLTEFINDCDNNYDLVSKNGICYMDGGFREPYGDEDQYIVLKNKFHDEFYIDRNHISGTNDGVPNGIELSAKIQKVLKSKLAMKIKLEAIENIVRTMPVN